MNDVGTAPRLDPQRPREPFWLKASRGLVEVLFRLHATLVFAVMAGFGAESLRAFGEFVALGFCVDVARHLFAPEFRDTPEDMFRMAHDGTPWSNSVFRRKSWQARVILVLFIAWMPAHTLVVLALPSNEFTSTPSFVQAADQYNTAIKRYSYTMREFSNFLSQRKLIEREQIISFICMYNFILVVIFIFFGYCGYVHYMIPKITYEISIGHTYNTKLNPLSQEYLPYMIFAFLSISVIVYGLINTLFATDVYTTKIGAMNLGKYNFPMIKYGLFTWVSAIFFSMSYFLIALQRTFLSNIFWYAKLGFADKSM